MDILSAKINKFREGCCLSPLFVVFDSVAMGDIGLHVVGVAVFHGHYFSQNDMYLID